MLYIGADYAGFDLKTKLVAYLKKQLKLKIEDLGTFKKTEDDFVDYAVPVAKAVAKNEENRGILICNSGHGMNIAANKIKGARASIGYSIEGAELARTHDNVNILSLSSRALTPKHAAAIVKKFLETDFIPLERRLRRMKKIAKLEK